MIFEIMLAACITVGSNNINTVVEPTTIVTEVSENDIYLLAQLAAAEAVGESEYGQRLVIDTVLNRMDADEFPNTIEKVIFQKNQYSPTIDGRLYEFTEVDDLMELVKQELEERTNTEVLYFRTKRYSKYGDPLFVEGHHYFSGKKEIANE